MSKRKILLVHNYYQRPGGEDTVVQNEKRLLEENGYRVMLYSRSNSEIEGYHLIQKMLLPFETVFSVKTYREVRNLIRKEHIGLVHVHNTLSLISPSVFYAAFSCKVPVVQTLHNFRMACPNGLFYRNSNICEECLYSGLWHSIKHRCYRNSFLQTAVSALVLKFHRILGTYRKVYFICLTEFNKEKLLSLNVGKKKVVDERKVFVKPNICNITREPIPWCERKAQFVYAGRLDQIKGIRMLVKGWREIKNADLILCGSGFEETWIRDYAAKNQMENVKLLGTVEHEKVIDIMAESKGTLLLSQWYEGFPMTVLESWAVHTPVIGSNIGNIGNLIDEYGYGWKVSKVEEIKGVVDEILNRKEWNWDWKVKGRFSDYKDIMDKILGRE